LSQPAASQQLAALERAMGSPLFVRTPKGVEPTGEGVALYAETASALDQLEAVLARLKDGQSGRSSSPLRVGSTAEFFSSLVLPRIGSTDLAAVATFGDDAELHDQLERGDIDVAVMSSVPGRRSFEAVAIGEKQFALVASPHVVSGPFASLTEVGDWLMGQPWVAYSLELPITRRFWEMHLGRPFSARLRLVAPDLRAVTGAVERGMGCSILPRFVCAGALDERRIVEVHDVSDLIPGEPWFACFRSGDMVRPSVARFVELFDT
jgi:DNA-binding transcriptional LysR family regulator